MIGRKGTILSLALMIAAQAFIPETIQQVSVATLQSAPTIDPLGRLEGVGVPGSISWSGDGQRLTNPSFETGLGPWTQSQANTANGSAITLSNMGYVGTMSAELSVYSGNSSALSLASDSTIGLTDDLTQQGMVFNSATRLRLAVQVQTITGTTVGDLVEVSLTMTTSIGNIRTMHYIFADKSTLQSNSTTDGYLKVPGFGATGQWITIDRNLPADTAAVFADAATINSVQSITLKVHAQSLPGAQLVDPHIKYWDSAGFAHWAYGEPVVYDTNNNGVYDAGETVIGCGYPNLCSPPPTTTALSIDPKLKFVDVNHDGVWNCSATSGNVCTTGEPVVYDNDIGFASGDGVYDYGEPSINCSSTLPTCTPASPPIPGTLLMSVVQSHTLTLFDQVELYTATGGYNWVRNGGFEAGLTGWYTNSSFASSIAPVHSGLNSVAVSITGGAAEMAQSIDAQPQVSPMMTFQASVNVGTMAGTSTSDSVDLWVGLYDSQGITLGLYYYFGTGTGTIPANRTDAVFLKTNGFGTRNQWLNVNASLLQVIQAAVLSNSLSYTAPYSVELVVLEASSSAFKTTTVNFDDISLGAAVSQTSSASSYFYALDGLNTTHVYTATSIPQGSFSLDIPQGRTMVNVTSPEGTALLTGEYSTSISAGIRRVTVLNSASFRHAPVGDWKFFTSSTNGVATVYVEDPASHAQDPSVSLNSIVNFVSQSKDPFGQPLQTVPVNLTLWNSSSVQVAPGWSGVSNSQGWWNASSITLPLSGTSAGLYRLQATVLSLYPGVRTFQVVIHYTATIDMTLSASQTTEGTSITISGTVTRTDVSGPAPGVSVTVQYRIAGNAQWVNITTVQTDSLGEYSYTWNPPQGEYQVRAETSDTQTGVVTSSPAHLIVNPAGLSGFLLLIIVAVAAAAVAVIVVFIVLRRKNRPHLSAKPSAPVGLRPAQKSDARVTRRLRVRANSLAKIQVNSCLTALFLYSAEPIDIRDKLLLVGDIFSKSTIRLLRSHAVHTSRQDRDAGVPNMSGNNVVRKSGRVDGGD